MQLVLIIVGKRQELGREEMSQRYWLIIVDSVEELRLLQNLIREEDSQAFWFPTIEYKVGWCGLNCVIASTTGAEGIIEDLTTVGIHFEDCISCSNAKGIDNVPSVEEEDMVSALEEAQRVAQEHCTHNPTKMTTLCNCGQRMQANNEGLLCFACASVCELVVSDRCSCESTLLPHLSADKRSVTMRCGQCHSRFVPLRSALSTSATLSKFMHRTLNKSIGKRTGAHKKMASLSNLYAK